MTTLKDLKKEFEEDWEFILYGLQLDISYQLKKQMERKGMTKKELAQKSGISTKKLTKIFSGDITNLRDVAKICAALGLDDPILILVNKNG
jgi:DNA-binding Xre family transcriptional regulator